MYRLFFIPEPEIRRLLSEVIEMSVGEILPPVVTRSVSIALITTRELVLKDFTYDSDVKKVNGAIDEIVKNLAGSLALVTCREPLRLSLT
jgi:CCR4-NOT transcription complex subunit 1